MFSRWLGAVRIRGIEVLMAKSEARQVCRLFHGHIANDGDQSLREPPSPIFLLLRRRRKAKRKRNKEGGGGG
jgi:hypothetical protein